MYIAIERFKLLPVVLFLLVFISSIQTSAQNAPPKIAIVGAGIGGCSSAYFLRQLLGANAVIDVYEYGKVGGRLATTLIAGNEYEIGGSILHPRNKYMSDFATQFGMGKKKSFESDFAIYNGKDILYHDSSKWWLVSVGKLLWRYGLSPFKTASFIETLLSGFDNVYELQENGESFVNVSDLLGAMDPLFPELTQISLGDALKNMGVKETFISELVTAITRVNYGQSADVHAFVGSVSLAGAGADLWSVQGGNKLVPERLLNNSQATLVRCSVSNITALEHNYRVSCEGQEEEYEKVIIAHPLLSDSGISFTNFPDEITISEKMHRTVCTMVHGLLNHSYFGLDSAEELPKEIFTINDNQPFTSINWNYPVDISDGSKGYPPVYKIFSKEPLSDKVLQLLFSSLFEYQVTDWPAYPAYDTPQALGSFVLHDNLFYVNAIEWAASAMEMSLIGAKNVALLIANKQRNILPKTAYTKTEL